jgi:hypothetical protein
MLKVTLLYCIIFTFHAFIILHYHHPTETTTELLLSIMATDLLMATVTTVGIKDDGYLFY